MPPSVAPSPQSVVVGSSLPPPPPPRDAWSCPSGPPADAPCACSVPPVLRRWPHAAAPPPSHAPEAHRAHTHTEQLWSRLPLVLPAALAGPPPAPSATERSSRGVSSLSPFEPFPAQPASSAIPFKAAPDQSVVTPWAPTTEPGPVMTAVGTVVAPDQPVVRPWAPTTKPGPVMSAADIASSRSPLAAGQDAMVNHQHGSAGPRHEAPQSSGDLPATCTVSVQPELSRQDACTSPRPIMADASDQFTANTSSSTSSMQAPRPVMPAAATFDPAGFDEAEVDYTADSCVPSFSTCIHVVTLRSQALRSFTFHEAHQRKFFCCIEYVLFIVFLRLYAQRQQMLQGLVFHLVSLGKLRYQLLRTSQWRAGQRHLPRRLRFRPSFHRGLLRSAWEHTYVFH